MEEFKKPKEDKLPPEDIWRIEEQAIRNPDSQISRINELTKKISEIKNEIKTFKKDGKINNTQETEGYLRGLTDLLGERSVIEQKLFSLLETEVNQKTKPQYNGGKVRIVEKEALKKSPSYGLSSADMMVDVELIEAEINKKNIEINKIYDDIDTLQNEIKSNLLGKIDIIKKC